MRGRNGASFSMDRPKGTTMLIQRGPPTNSRFCRPNIWMDKALHDDSRVGTSAGAKRGRTWDVSKAAKRNGKRARGMLTFEHESAEYHKRAAPNRASNQANSANQLHDTIRVISRRAPSVFSRIRRPSGARRHQSPGLVIRGRTWPGETWHS